MGECTFSSKKGEVGKIVEKGFLGRLTNLCLYKSEKHHNPRCIQQWQVLNKSRH